MITTTALPPKAEKIRCTTCGFEARPPIVVSIPRDADTPLRRCANRTECDRRLRRAKAKAKEIKS